MNSESDCQHVSGLAGGVSYGKALPRQSFGAASSLAAAASPIRDRTLHLRQAPAVSRYAVDDARRIGVDRKELAC